MPRTHHTVCPVTLNSYISIQAVYNDKFPKPEKATDEMCSNHVTKLWLPLWMSCCNIVYDSQTTEYEINLAPLLFPL